ncbi:MAG: LysM peptidoglycan-binding domain-containing protein, partial [Fibrobacter sp.]|nr:LysM peptidoglycan-binding domain-containing protein [Fibrobacter sp.]
NMELVKWCTPPNKESYLLRLPVGTRSAFVEGYDKMEKNNFSSWHHHKVRKGENLGIIARQYGIKISELQQANDMKNTRIRAGQSLLIPIKVTPKPKANRGKKPQKVRTYIVQSGDDVAAVARKFGISQDSVRAWNSLDVAAVVKAGDTLVVSKPEPTPQVENESAKNQPSKNRPKLAKGEKYAVREGDTYAAIAKTFDIPVVMLMQANQGFNKRLMVGDSLVIPEYVRKKGEKKQAKSESSKPAAKKPSNEKVSVYIVQQGDNLSSISRKFGTSVAKLQELNNMGSNTNLSVGQKLKVAGAPEVEYKIHTVKKGEGLWDIARQYKVTIEDIVKWNDLQDTKIKMGQKLKIKR